MNRFIPKSAER
ncbi:hypothetical protein LINPERPRIM_LOCUS37002 [Linum perenne]